MHECVLYAIQYTMYTVKAKRKISFTFDPGGHGPDIYIEINL